MCHKVVLREKCENANGDGGSFLRARLDSLSKSGGSGKVSGTTAAE